MKRKEGGREKKRERKRAGFDQLFFDVGLQCNYYENKRSFTKFGRSNLITKNQLLELVRGCEVRVQRHLAPFITMVITWSLPFNEVNAIYGMQRVCVCGERRERGGGREKEKEEKTETERERERWRNEMEEGGKGNGEV